MTAGDQVFLGVNICSIVTGGLIKNKYIGRTFIAPGQEHRLDQVRLKLSAVEETVAGKRVVLVDDSIVRQGARGYLPQCSRREVTAPF